MELDVLLYNSYRKTIDEAVDFVLKNPEYYKQAIELSFADKKQVSARAARVVYYAALANSELILPYNNAIIKNLQSIRNKSAKSTLLAAYAKLDLPDDDELLGILVERCFDIMSYPNDIASLKIYAIEILYKISQIYPELKHELSLTIKNHFENCLPSFYSRGRTILDKIGENYDED